MKILPAILAAMFLVAPASLAADVSPDSRYSIGEQLFSDDFSTLASWTAELEKGGKFACHDHLLEIDVPAGCSAWFTRKLSGPLLIEYQAMAVLHGGPNDRVSDVNCFWMATDPRQPAGKMFDHLRTGKFSDYDALLTYYVGLGGNGNSTTRFRRYIGKQDNRPLLPQNDRRDPADLLTPNRWQTIRLVACGPLIQYWRDDKKLFEMSDEKPYESGWFALRTTFSHLLVRNLRVHRLAAAATQPSR